MHDTIGNDLVYLECFRFRKDYARIQGVNGHINFWRFVKHLMNILLLFPTIAVHAEHEWLKISLVQNQLMLLI